MRKRPPQHRVDAPGYFIPATDLSFDKERYEKEIQKMKEEGEDIESHPIRIYYSGKSRWDLEASGNVLGKVVKASEYFGSDCERWKLRRLSWDEWYEVTGMIGDDGQKATLKACRYGVVSVENAGFEIKQDITGMLPPKDMQKIFELDPGLPLSLGNAVVQYSMPLTDSEKKA